MGENEWEKEGLPGMFCDSLFLQSLVKELTFDMNVWVVASDRKYCFNTY